MACTTSSPIIKVNSKPLTNDDDEEHKDVDDSELDEPAAANNATTSPWPSKESTVRNRQHNAFVLFLVNGYAAFLVLFYHLISYETIFSILLGVSMTLVTYYKTEDNVSWDGGIMNWILLSFAIVTPMSASIGMAFTRRESALRNLAIIRSTFLELYIAHAIWDWSSAKSKEVSGRRAIPFPSLEHSDQVMIEMIGVGTDLERLLTLPNASRTRYRTGWAPQEARDLVEVSQGLVTQIQWRMGKITVFTEVLKHNGLPPNEATRLRQWERDIMFNLDSIRMLKAYRTPQALRSLCRIFSVFLPPFYAPYYAQMARDIDSLGIGIAFSIITSLALTALFECLIQLEDPFVGHVTLDGIDCYNELRVIYPKQFLIMRLLYFPNAPEMDTTAGLDPTGRSIDQPRIFKDGG